MKACPTCQRTYADDMLTFCLVDGSVLSAPYDPQATLVINGPRVTDPSPAPRATQPAPATTILSPQPAPLQQGVQQTRPKESKSAAPWMLLGMAVAFLGILAVWAFIRMTQPEREPAGNRPPESNVSNVSASPSPTATATVGKDGWGAWDENASINEGERITYYPTTTPEKCQADCDVNPRCKAFTYIRAGAYNPGDSPMCYLMSEVRKIVPSPCCITAVRTSVK